MKKRISGIIIACWGAAIIIRTYFFVDNTGKPAAYVAGQNAALVVAAAMVVGGLYMVFSSLRGKKNDGGDGPA